MGRFSDMEKARAPAAAKRKADAAAKAVRLKKAADAADKVRAAKAAKAKPKPVKAKASKPVSRGSLTGSAKEKLKRQMGVQ